MATKKQLKEAAQKYIEIRSEHKPEKKFEEEARALRLLADKLRSQSYTNFTNEQITATLQTLAEAQTLVLACKEKRNAPGEAINAEEILAELKAVDKMFTLKVEEEGIYIILGPYTFSGIELGRFKLWLKWQAVKDHDYIWLSAEAMEPHPHNENEDCTHPHVESGTICLGRAEGPTRSAQSEHRLFDLFMLAESVLNHVNHGSQYSSIETWEEDTSICTWEEDTSICCEDCGDSVAEEFIRCCADCKESICEGCSRKCTDCSPHRFYCGDCTTRCTTCAEHLCPAHRKVACSSCNDFVCKGCAIECSECEDKYCKGCYGEQTLCENCHEKKEEETCSPLKS